MFFQGIVAIKLLISKSTQKLSLFFRLCWHGVGMFALLFFVPMIIASVWITSTYAPRTLGYDLFASILWIYMYFIGVFLNYHLYQWANKVGIW